MEGNSGRSKGQGHPQHTENSRPACSTTLKTRSKRTRGKISFKVLILRGEGGTTWGETWIQNTGNSSICTLFFKVRISLNGISSEKFQALPKTISHEQKLILVLICYMTEKRAFSGTRFLHLINKLMMCYHGGVATMKHYSYQYKAFINRLKSTMSVQDLSAILSLFQGESLSTKNFILG